MDDNIRTASGESSGGVRIDNEVGNKDNTDILNSPGRSSEVVHTHGSPDACLIVDNALSPCSPLHPGNLNFDRLTIDDCESDILNSAEENFFLPFRRTSRTHPETNASGLPLREFNRKDNYARSRFQHNTRTAGGSIRNSRTWMSPDQQAQQEFLVIRNSMRRLFKNSEVSKWKLTDYIAHREAMIASQAKWLAKRVKDKEESQSRSLQSPVIPIEVQQKLRRWGLNGNFDEHGNFGRVLGERTIWCTDWQNGKDEIAPWPSMAEMKWEGDDRAKTGVGRFLPLPREEGPPTLQWNQLPVIEQYPIDQIARIPTLEDIYLPVDDQIEPECEYLWSKELEKEMDTFLQS